MKVRKTYELTQSPLYKLRSRSKLAKLLAISNHDLREISAGDSLYREFDIDKKGGGIRHVENPRHRLKVAQTRIARLLSRITPPDYLFCPVKGRCYVTNALHHTGNRVVRTLDIRKYFPSTSSKRVFWFYRQVLQCANDIAGLLTRMSTYQGHLPTGSPLSPILSYFAHFDLWAEVARRCAAKGLTVTVYIDDCTISGPKVPTSFFWEIKQLIYGAGLRYHKEKRFIDRPAEITGVIVQDGRARPPHRQFLKLKKAADEWVRVPGDEALGNRVRGLEAQIRQVQAVRPA